MKCVLLVCLLVVACVESVSIPYLKYIPKVVDRIIEKNDDWPPSFCNGLACPKFKVLKDNKDYQLREYEPSMWVSTNTLGADYEEACRTNFEKLFDYISGKNAKEMKIDMTAPVITQVIPGPGPACASNFTTSFYVNIPNPPAASDKTVFFQKFPRLQAYVRSFTGYDMFSVKPWLQEAMTLQEILEKNSLQYNKNFFYTGGYDSPFKFLNRHNEVWWLA